MTHSDDSNKAGDTKTTSDEYIKRESGEHNSPHVPAENPGLTSTSQDDLDHPEQHNPDQPDPANDAVAKKIKDTNHEDDHNS